ncbi:MBOAT family protein [Noviherbaspirillum cavernae]|uniref:Probable alginate O-acetylase AlgI n=1 Tax=Noviherbaspirillum cavernae TaxID=2320862 RepID=A0A418X3Z8_9BURK|nr:MBOAT family protein [Noviherbaspirillum cavernae]RJG07121.1 MBOAT family protein [Noviherbaspirillum cavernae]
MLFNSYFFLLVFLPLSLLGFFLLGRFGKSVGANWLAACSLFFYAWWDSRYIALLLGSICVNYLAGSYIASHAGKIKARTALIVAIAANVLLLGYYKYADFFVTSANAVFETNWPVLGVILPIGISFFTFTQIAFLVDAWAGKVREYRFVNYVLFVTYFPHLVAGPVLHHKEMMPQFDDGRNYYARAENFAIGLTIFAIGLAKKVLIADNLSTYANPIFSAQASTPSFFLAWGGALTYTFQLYFDFSGYSDMAIGLSRLFGVRLPLNFNSPYKSHNIAEFWRRWHMTLSRFLRDYLYIPLGGNRHGATRRQINLMTTMVLGGLWHGAGWNFAIWGLLHGGFLVVNQHWKSICRRTPFRLPPRYAGVFSVMLTFLSVVVAWVYFRAPDVATANRIIMGMAGSAGAALPDAMVTRLGPLAQALDHVGIKSYLGGGATFFETWCWIVVSALIAFLTPNTQEIMRRFEPALPDESHVGFERGHRLAWMPQRRSAMVVGLLFALGVLALSRPTEFLYFQF